MSDARVIPICCVCNRVREEVQAISEGEYWDTLGAFLKRHHIANEDYQLSHTYCPACAAQFRKLYEYKPDRQIPHPRMAASRSRSHATDAILEVFSSVQKCDLDMLVRACPTLTWNQVFSEVDRLSRTGKLRLSYLGRGRYSIELPDSADMTLVAQA